MPSFNPRLIGSLIFAVSLWCSGCNTTETSSKKHAPIPRPPPTANGVRITKAGAAVAEVDFPLDTTFEAVQVYLKNNMNLSFTNSYVGKLEAEDSDRLFSVDFTPLSTGKTGLTVTVLPKSGLEKRPDAMTARDFADELITSIKASIPGKATKVPLKAGSIETRSQ